MEHHTMSATGSTLHPVTLAVTLLLVLSSATEITASERCLRPGDIICSADCSAIQLCLTASVDEYLPHDLEVCPADTYCYSNKKACIAVNTCDPANLPGFECTRSTVLPDQYDCTVYHVCRHVDVTWYQDTLACDEGYAFDSVSKTCRLKMADEPVQCVDNGVPTCRRLGEALPYVYNSNLFFLCKGIGEILYPVLYECKGGQEFVGGSCSDVLR